MKHPSTIINKRDTFSTLQNDIYQNLFYAVKNNDLENYSFLEAKWVHRFGITSLPDKNEIRNLIKINQQSDLINVDP